MQIAKAQGAFVATTCSGRNAEFVTKLGADRAIDYTKERYGPVQGTPMAPEDLCQAPGKRGCANQVPLLRLTMVPPSMHSWAPADTATWLCTCAPAHTHTMQAL